MLKLLFHRETRKPLGAHIVGHGASELVHIGQAALAFEAAVAEIAATSRNLLLSLKNRAQTAAKPA